MLTELFFFIKKKVDSFQLLLLTGDLQMSWVVLICDIKVSYLELCSVLEIVDVGYRKYVVFASGG